ncbi:MAG: ATP-dependent chaperone ClpB [Bacteroidetes bacterium GWF2_33_16]|nr:MAG: ATP-dependent chaperone ClpB [Bacteroidetes bacterium GWE2_32_14]OFY03817.1 MAG: ATP-dependent chaperone ClpB [Bacteroidetes bacterium GWF2_33_16]
MKTENFTIKSQEVIQQAFTIAQGNQQQVVENGHLLKSIFLEDENISNFLFKKLNIDLLVFQKALDKIILSYPKVSGGDPYLSNNANKALQKALNYSKEMDDQFISIEHILLGIFAVSENVSQLMKDNGITEKGLKLAIQDLRKGSNVKSQTAEDTFNSLNRFAINLIEQARAGKLDPVIGRDDEIRRVLQILSRRTKNNPILIGEPGVGKTAIAEGIAHRILSGDIPENLKSKEVFALDMGALIAGAKYKGEFEERLKSVVNEVISSNGDIVLFIDEIHTLVGAGKGEGAMDAANILKPALARGELRAIGATTLNEYQKYFENDKALERRFQKVLVDEPDTLSAISILRGLKERYESHHKVRIMDDAIITAVELSQRYISDRFLPDKAIDLIDEAAAKLRLEMNSVPESIDEIERKIKQLEIEREAIKREGDKKKVSILSEQIANLSDERNKLKAKWQNEKNIANQIQDYKETIEKLKLDADQAERDGEYGKVAELRYGKIKDFENKATILKDELLALQQDSAMINEEVNSDDIAEIVAKWTGIPVSRMLQSEREKLLNLENELHKRVVGQDVAIAAVADAVRRSRAGLQDSKKPIGSFIFMGTTGVGKTELAKALAEFLFDNENMLTRIDMSEYQERHSVSRLVGAPPGYVGYDEGGQLTEAVRRKPYSVILLDEIEKAHPDVFNILLQMLDDGRLTDNKGRTVNFKNTIIIMTSNIGSHIIQDNIQKMNDKNREEIIESTKDEVLILLKQVIRPEFINRVDEIVMFAPLTKNEVVDIVKLQFEMLQALLKMQRIQIEITDEAIEYIANISFDPHYGARPVKRNLQKLLVNELSKQILGNAINKDNTIWVDKNDEGLIFKN